MRETRSRAGAVAVSAIVSAAASLPSVQAQDAPPTVIAFVHVDVLPMDEERVLRDQTVVVRGDQIVASGPAAATEVPADARVVEGNGKFLIPGLAEMHGHVPPPETPAQDLADLLFLYLANGVTTVRGMLGFPGQLDVKGRIERGELLGPTLYLAGPSFSGQSIDSAEQAAQRVRTQAQEGWDLLKIHPGLTREEYDAVAGTAREEGMRFAGHVPEEVGLLHAIEMGQETFDHLDGFVEFAGGDDRPLDQARLDEAIRRTREAGAWVVPTMALWETLLGLPELDALLALEELRYMPADAVAQWRAAHGRRLAATGFDREQARRVVEARMTILRSLDRGGAKILFGTDSPQQFSVPGFSIHHETRRMAEAGMSPFAILASATRNVGEYFANEDAFGTIAAGRRADLVLLDGNPLDDLGHLARPAGVMAHGRWLPAEEIRARLDEIAARRAGGESPTRSR